MTAFTRNELSDIHNEQLSNGKNNLHATMEIVNALGGIDELLKKHILNKDINITLNNDSIQKLHQILSESSSTDGNELIDESRLSDINNLDVLMEIAESIIHNDNNNNQEENKQTTGNTVIVTDRDEFPENTDDYSFFTDRDYLRSYFSEKTANKIQYIGSHPVPKTFLIIAFTLYIIFKFTVTDLIIWPISILLFTNCIWAEFFIYWALLINKKASKIIWGSFDSWVKIYYMFILAISDITYENYIKWNQWNYPILTFIAQISYYIVFIIFIFVVASFDGLHVSRMYKMLVSAFIGSACIFWGTYYAFLSYSNGDDSIINIYGEIAISMNAYRISAYRILGIFLLKQAIRLKFKPDQSMVISIHPVIQWNKIVQKRNSKKNENKLANYIDSNV